MEVLGIGAKKITPKITQNQKRIRTVMNDFSKHERGTEDTRSKHKS